jgi:hypothetical protein
MDKMTPFKIFSGKFVFTVITALVFAYSAWAKVLNGEQIYGVIMLVVAFYFNKNQEQTEHLNGGKNEETNPVNYPADPAEPGAGK